MHISKKRQLNPIENIWLLLLFVIILLNILVPRIAGIVSYGTYIAIFLLFILFITRRKFTFRIKWAVASLIILISGVFSTLMGSNYFPGVTEDIHMLVFFCAFAFLGLSCRWTKLLSYNFVSAVMKTLVIIGIAASLYALIFQGRFIPAIITSNDYYAYESFKSFFSQRNVFASFMFYSSLGALYFSRENKKYYFLIVIFAFDIFLANSRAALLGLGIMICLHFYLITKNKAFTALAGIIILIPIVYYIVLPLLSSRFVHVTSLGVSSTEIRTSQWLLGLQKLADNNNYLFGFGFGSCELFLRKFYSYGSFHNEYLDILFQGGIVLLVFYISAIWDCFKRSIHIKDRYLKDILLAALITHLAYGFFESSSMLFGNTYFSFLSTLVFCILPQCGDMNVERKE